jgi:predicted regulator of Ras-like GTPase activity (Roadblock/LC7/MglB family)
MARWKLKDLFWISPDGDDGDVTAPNDAPSEPPRTSRVPGSTANGSQTVESLLSTLKDIDGVIGSIVAGADGAVVGYDLPRTFDYSAAEGAARQMALLRTALATQAGEMKTGILRFRDFHFHVDEVPSGLIGILAAERADRPALRMAVRLLGRRIEEALRNA